MKGTLKGNRSRGSSIAHRTGGVFYAVGAGTADILSRNIGGVTANAEIAGASIENARRVSAGEMPIGYSSASTLYKGEESQGPFGGDPQNVATSVEQFPLPTGPRASSSEHQICWC